jgi:predicted phosphodiesterase
MIFVTGDTHGDIDFRKLNTTNFPEQKLMTRDDYLIILGDFGVPWCNDQTDEWLLNWHQDKNYTTLFVDGNHENFDLLYQLPLEEWNGGLVRKITPNILQLTRGQVFNLQGSTFFTFGGAASQDKETRKEFISWWSQEMPNYQEMDTALENLSAHDNQVDFILTHTAPNYVVKRILGDHREDPISRMLMEFDRSVSFKRWFFGHLHVDQQWDRYVAMYHKIRRIL